jgi:hypothetical protein
MFLGAGAGVIAFGVWLYHGPPTARCEDPDLEDKEMSPGDICIKETQGGEEVDRRTYDEVLDENRVFGLEWNQIFGVVVALVGCLIIVAAIVAVGMGLRERLIAWRSRPL